MADDEPIRLPYTPIEGATPIAPSNGEDPSKSTQNQNDTQDNANGWKEDPLEVTRIKEHDHYKKVRQQEKRRKKARKEREKQRSLLEICDNKPRDKRVFPWASYFDGRQATMGMVFDELARALIEFGVKNSGYSTGRPPFPIRDKIYFMVSKVLNHSTYDFHHTFITRYNHDRRIRSRPKAHSICDFMGDPSLTPILKQFVKFLSTPMANTDDVFAVDSSGFSTLDKTRWVNIAHNSKMKGLRRNYSKLHMMTGVKSHIIVAAEVTPGQRNDNPLLRVLLKEISPHFKIREVLADKGYLSKVNVAAIRAIGATPFIATKINSQPVARGHFPGWNAMVHMSQDKPEQWNPHYHMRSLAETVFSMMKLKLDEFLGSKTPVAKINEVYCLAIAHNLLVLISSYFCYSTEIKYRK